MTQNDFFELNQLLDTLDNDYDVNRGGCCFVAYVLAKHLEKLGIKYKIIFYSDYDVISYYKGRCLEVRGNIKKRLKDVFPSGSNNCSHYAIFLQDYKIRLNDAEYLGESNIKVGCVNSKDLLFIYQQGNWNSTYKAAHNRSIEKEISNFFKQHGKGN